MIIQAICGDCILHVTSSSCSEPMSDRFRLDVALYLADAASVRRKVTSGELCAKFGGASNDWGPILTLIADRLRKRGHPLLPVLVVADTGQPFIGETNCRVWGLVGKEAINLEQQRCFDFDWPSVFFQRHDAAGDKAGQVKPAKHDRSQADMVRHQADKVVDEFPDDALEILAADLESDTEHREGLATALAIATELRRRAAAGVRKWPGPKG
jgi:hypothetical protein